MERKKFIYTLFRIGVLGALAALIAVFHRNRQIALYADCPEVSSCKACGRYRSCALPEAEKSRNNG